MWKNSTELFEYALRELRVAASTNKNYVEIVLHNALPNDPKKIKNFCDTFEIKKLTELLRKEFPDYDLKSQVATGTLSIILTFQKGPCNFNYILLWKLTLQPKAE